MKQLSKTKIKDCLNEIEHCNGAIIGKWRGENCQRIQECVDKMWDIMREDEK